MRKLRCREIKQLSQGQGWGLGLTLVTCELGVAMCLTRASGCDGKCHSGEDVTVIHDVFCFLVSRWRHM